MNKKYFPYVALLGAVLLFVWVKKNQVGGKVSPHRTETAVVIAGGFNRNPEKIIYSKHARCRMSCRHIDESEVKEILQNGVLNEAKIETGSKGTSYPLEGLTHDGQKVRIVFAPHEATVVVVTVIDLEKEYACDCGN
jgi:Domain of unknown function (DUF4258)